VSSDASIPPTAAWRRGGVASGRPSDAGHRSVRKETSQSRAAVATLRFGLGRLHLEPSLPALIRWAKAFLTCWQRLCALPAPT